ncbi:MAG TPA: hypothetical protein PLR83_09875 [Pyrinomonadaceae bacterium]|nr:hypothetical protein [Pyrinomonadaceae bacterium]
MAIKFSTTFLLRKLHQVTGIVPLGMFYFVHIYTNVTAMNGPKVFNDHVQDIHNIPFLLFIEVFGIFLPLAYHSIYGMLISGEAKVNVLSYPYARNWFYLFQRITGVFLFFFLLFHLLNFRFGLIPGLNMTPVAGHAQEAFSIVSTEFQKTWVVALYVLGVLATAWHLGYGFFLFAVDWGVVISEKAQRLTIKAALALAVLLGLVGVNAVFAFVRPCGLLPQSLCESTHSNRKPTGPERF